MEFARLLEIVADEPLFETGMLIAGDVTPADIHRQLSRWKETAKVYQLRRGFYTLAPPYCKSRPHPFLVANRIVPASYVSLQSALAYYGMIPEYTPVTTSVTTNRPGHWETPLGVFDYRHIQVGFFDGFRFIDLGSGQHAFLATPEKALLDLVYLEPGGDSLNYLRELRLENLNRLDWRSIEQLAFQSDRPKLIRAVAAVKKLVSEEEEYISL